MSSGTDDIEPTAMTEQQNTQESGIVTEAPGNENPVMSQSREIDLSQLKPKYNVKTKPTMRPLLSEYGLPEEKRKPETKDKEDGKHSKTKKGKLSTSWTEDRAAEKDKQKKEQQLRMYESIYKLRDQYYQRYARALQDKVEQQREEIKKKTEQIENQIQRQEHTEKQEQHKVTKRLMRHELTHDESFLKRLPKSSYYKIVALLDKLKATGQIRTQTDVDMFWNNIRKPEIFKKYFPLSLQGRTDTSSVFSNSQQDSQNTGTEGESQAKPPDALDLRPLTGITEISSRPSTRDATPWAVTQQVKHKYRKPAKSPDPYAIAKEAAVAMEKRFPPMVLPKLHCFEMELGEKPPDPEVVMEEFEAKKREQERKVFVRRLRKMYHLALSNTASAQRIMEEHQNELDLALEGPSIAELTSYYHDTSDDEGSHNFVQERAENIEQPWMKYIHQAKTIGTIEEVSENTSRAETSGKTTANSRRSRSAGHMNTDKRTSIISERTTGQPQPLSLECISENQSTIMEPRCKSTLWSNYMNAGKSLFAGQ